MHSDSIDEHDLRILAELRETHARLDPVPSALADRVKFAMTVQALHAEVAELTLTPLAASRGDAEISQTETITFTSQNLSVMVTVSEQTPVSARVDGWVTLGGASIELRTAAGTREATADANGRFSFDGVPRGQAQIVLRAGSEASPRTVITPSFDL